MIDNSSAMAAAQLALTRSFASAVDLLEAEPGGLPNLHVGVISSDLGAGGYNISDCTGDGDRGLLQDRPNGSCAVPINRFITDVEDGAGGRVKNYTGALGDVFTCIARVGEAGCGFEQPLAAIRRALDGSNPQNVGFLRSSARLAVVLLTNEDDCSVDDPSLFDPSAEREAELGPLGSFRCFEFGVVCSPDHPRTSGSKEQCEPRADSPYLSEVSDIVSFLKSLKDQPSQVSVVGIIGDPSPVAVERDEWDSPSLAPSCTGDNGEAVPAVRIAGFLDGFHHTATTSVCGGSMTQALYSIGREAGVSLRHDHCLDGVIYDRDVATDGLQVDCEVVEAPSAGEPSILPVCDRPEQPDDSTQLPCYLVHAESGCSAGGFEIATFHRSAPPAGSRITATCLVVD